MEKIKVKNLKNCLCGLLIVVAMLLGVVFSNNRTAVTSVNAVSFEDTTSYVSIGELFNSVTRSFNKGNFQILKECVVQSAPSLEAEIVTAAQSGWDASDIRGVVVGEVSAYAQEQESPAFKSAGQDVVVRLGGLDWQVMYLSTDKSDNPILTLWLSNHVQDAWSSRAKDEGNYYGFVESGLYGSFSGGWDGSLSAENLSCLYGTSYMNAVVLNNGGLYANSETDLVEVEKNSDSAFALFTMEELGLTDYLVTPRNVSWQELQSNREIVGDDVIDYLNDGWYGYASESLEDTYKECVNREHYGDWADSYLWLPSIAEVGGYYSQPVDGDANLDGLWKTSQNQRKTYDGVARAPTVSVGKLYSNGYNYTLLRSFGECGGCVFTLYEDGSDAGSHDVSGVYAVRPALHLNLKAIEDSLNAVSIEGGTLTTGATSYTYTGSSIKPSVTLVVGGTTLVQGTDYDLTYSSNTTDVGTVTVTATGKGNYTGTKTATYTITSLNLSDCIISLSQDTYVYDGTAKTPSVLVSYDNGGNVVNFLSDNFSISYSNNINANNGALKPTVLVNTKVVNGVKNFTGSRLITFTINPRSILTDLNYVLDNTDWVYTGNLITPSITSISCDGTYLIADTDYQIVSYSNNTNAGSSARINIKGIGNYTDSKSISFTISPRNISVATVSQAVEDKTFTATQIRPTDFGLSFNGQTLTAGTDYTTAYGTNFNRGNGTIEITGTGNFTGTKTITFNILPRDIAECYVELSATNLTYNTSAQTVSVSVKINGNTVSSSNYSISGTMTASNAGTYSISINPAGNLTGDAVEKTFTIHPKAIESNMVTQPIRIKVTLDEDGNIIPVSEEQLKEYLILNYSNDRPLACDEDYTFVLQNADTIYDANGYKLNSKIPLAIITGKGNYANSISVYFSIYANHIGYYSEAAVSIPYTTHVYTGGSIQPVVTAMWGGITLTRGTDYTVAYSNNVNVGTATVKITGINDYYGTVSKTFTITPFNIAYINGSDASLSPSVHTYTGLACNPTIQVRYFHTNYFSHNENEDGECSTVACTSAVCNCVNGYSTTLINNTHYTYEISDNINAGTGKVTISAISGNYTGTKVLEFTINPRTLSSCTVASIGPFNYTGSSINPKPTITYDNGIEILTLASGRDYRVVSYTNNVNVGTATMKIEGLGNYTGIINSGFTINANNLTSITAQNTFVYDGTTKTQTFVVKYDTKVLTVGKDYTLSGTTSAAVGGMGYTVTATGMGGYSGQVSTTWTISARDLSDCDIIVDDSDLIYNGNYLYPKLEIRVKEDTSKVIFSSTTISSNFTATNFSIQCNSDSKNAGEHTFNIQGKNSLSGNLTASYTISSRDIADELVKFNGFSTYMYTGSAIEPNVRMSCNDRTLVLDIDYSVQYTNNINVGQATVKVAGKGNFTGNKTLNFTIVACNISDGILNGESVVYSGEIITPKSPLIVGGKTLVLGTDFDIEYSLNGEVVTEIVNAGSYTITATGKGNYTGTKKSVFNVLSKEIDVDNVTFTEREFIFFPAYVHLDISVADEETLVKTQDYVIEIYKENDLNTLVENACDAGNYVVYVKGIGNYTGVVSLSFIIRPLAITDEGITLNTIDSQIYTGFEIKPTIEIDFASAPRVIIGYTLSEGIDYELTYSNNTDAGEATITITGKGNFSGTREVKFTILQKDISSGELSVVGSYAYTGLEIIPEISVVVDGKTLGANDYIIVASNNLNVGTTASVAVTGKGNYTGNIPAVLFEICARNLSEVVIGSVGTQNYTGNDIKPVPNITLGAKTLTEGVDFTCSYENNVSVGTAIITITGKGNFEGEQQVTFNIGALLIDTVTLTASTFTYDATQKGPNVIVKSNNEILTKDLDYSITGNTSAIDAGEYTITITGIGGYSGTFNKSWSISVRALRDCTISLDNDVYTYSGLEHKPNITVVLGTEENIISDENYTIEYLENIDAGTGKVVVTGKGNLEGTVNKTFTINQKSMMDSDVVVTIEKQIYTGTEIQPEMTITYNGMTLVPTTDYTCSDYLDNVNVGTEARVLVVGSGNYTAIKVVYFEIEARDIAECEVLLSDYTFEYNAQSQEVSVLEVKFGSIVIDSSNYRIEGNLGVNAGTYNVVVYGENNLKGENNSQSFVISSKALNITMVADIPWQRYIHDGNGNATAVTLDESELILSWVNEVLSVGDDYTFELTNATEIYEDNTFETSENIPTVTITGKGNYTGTISKHFIIYDNNLKVDEEASVALLYSSHVYTGYEIKPKVSVKWDGVELELGTDYKVAYSDNTYVGTATVTITGIGAYNDIVTKTFEIVAVDIQYLKDTDVLLSESEFTYNGQAHEPTLSLIYTHGNLCEELCNDCGNNCETSCLSLGQVDLTQGVDYTYEITNNVNAGTAIVTITGKGNFTGTKTINFVVKPADISIAEIGDLEESSYKYTGSEVTPEIVVTCTMGNEVITLEKDADYTVSYENNINIGQATIIATGKGNYAGRITKTFRIYANSIETISLSETTFVYDATSKNPTVIVKSGDKILANGVDYDVVDDTSAIDVGIYTISVVGKGNYDGTLSTDWIIESRNIADCDVSVESGEFGYTGNEIQPTIIVKINESVVPSEMYTMVYVNNTEVGNGQVVVTGNTNLTGSVTKTFVITKGNIADAQVTNIPSQNYTGDNVEPSVTLTFNGKALRYNEDYTIEYFNNINAGENAIVEITGKGNFEGTLTKTFVILPRSISSETLTISNNVFIYTGSIIDVQPKLVVMGVELEQGVDYSVEYRISSPTGEVATELINVGNYYLMVTGIANYTGSKFVGFNIVKATPSVSVVCLDTDIFAGKTVRLGIDNSSIEGTVFCSQSTYVEGEFEYEWMFVPEDTTNYNVVVGTITLTAIKFEVVGLEFSGEYKTEYLAYETLNTMGLVVSLKFNNGETQELYSSGYSLSMLNGAILRVGDRVTVRYLQDSNIKGDLPITIAKRVIVSSSQDYISNGEEQEITFTFANALNEYPVTYSAIYYNATTGAIVDSIVRAGKYKAILTLQNNNYELSNNEVLFEVCSKTISSEDSNLHVESDNGFSSDEVFAYDIETNETLVLQDLGLERFNTEKEFVSVYTFDLVEDKDVIITFKPDVATLDGVEVYKLTNNVLVSVPYTIVEGTTISISCNTADKLLVFKNSDGKLQKGEELLQFMNAIGVLLTIIVIGLVITLIIDRPRKKAEQSVNNSSLDVVRDSETIIPQNDVNVPYQATQEQSVEQMENLSDDELIARYIITDNEGNAIGLRDGAPEALRQAFNNLTADKEKTEILEKPHEFTQVEEVGVEHNELAGQEFVASDVESPIEKEQSIDENSIIDNSIVETSVVENVIDEVVVEEPKLSQEEMVAQFAIVDESGMVVGLREGAPEELKEAYSSLLEAQETIVKPVEEQQSINYEEMISKYAIIDENGNVIGIREDAPEELKQTYNNLLNNNQ